MAQGRFGKYKKEDSHGIRQAETSGGEIQRLRQLREMLRSMTPGQAMQVMEFYLGLNVFEALALAKKEGALIVPNYVHDRILTESEDKAFVRNCAVWTGTAVIHEAKGKAFGETAVFRWNYADAAQHAISFVVPAAFRGKKDCALVVEHPDFDFISLGSRSYGLRVSDEGRIHLLKNFPREYGWYHYDEKSRIPAGDQVRAGGRYLRRNNGSYLGLVARGDWGGDGNGRDVLLGAEPSVGIRVAVVR
ncbi:MAG: hypothetical protein AB1529_03845 [Candidatus Micrarchaeota archaeon]